MTRVFDEYVLDAIEHGNLIETGWRGYAEARQRDASPASRETFYAGALHLFAGMMAALNQPTTHEVDVARMKRIEDELVAFVSRTVHSKRVSH